MDEERLLLALRVLASRPDDTEPELESAFCARGFAACSAFKMVVLVPLAFGRVLLAHMGISSFSTTFVLYADDGTTCERALEREPIFCAALQLATRMLHEGPKNLFSAAATRSAEVAVASRALKAEADISGATLHPPKIFLGSLAQWDAE